MTTFGKYLVVDVVSLSAGGSVSTARPVAGGHAAFAVKQYKAAQPADPDEPQWDLQRFLDRARVQKSVVASGGRYWLAVHDMGLTPDGAWVVYDYVPLSAQKLIDGEVKIRPAGLYNLVNSVVKGLVELQQVRRRGHGCLKPANILIAGDDLSDARVLLTDPTQSASEPATGDLYALGQLVHELVVHRPFTGKPWPLAEGEEWHQLGPQGEQWRELCSALLAPAAAVRPDLVDVARMLRDLAPKKKKLPRRYLVAPAAAACLALGVLALIAVQVGSARNEFARLKSGWVAPLAAAISDPQRHARYQADRELKAVMDDLQRSHIAQVSTDGGLFSRFSLSELQRLRQANATAYRLEQALSPDHWQRLEDLSALQKRYEARGWAQPAGYLSELIAAAQPRPGANLAGALDRVLRVAPVLDQDRTRVEEQWQQLTDYAHQLEETHDRTLTSFASALRTSGGGAVRLSDAGFQGMDKLQAQVALAARLAEAVRPGWPGNIDSVRLAEDLHVNLKNPTPQEMELWLQKLPLYSLRKTETMLAAASLQKRLADTADRVNRLNPDSPTRTAFDRDRQEIQGELDRFSRTAYIEKEVEEGALANARDQLQTRIDSLQKYAQPRTPADWIRSLTVLATSSSRINDYWEQWKQAQLAAAEKGKKGQAELATLKVRAESAQTTLTDLDQRFPAVPADLNDAFREVARKRREVEIGKLLDAMDRTSPRLEPIRTAGAVTSYVDWCSMLRELAKDFPIRKEFLTPEDRPDEKWALQDAFWNDPDVQKLVAPDVSRLRALRALASLSRQDLLTTAQTSDRPEVAFEAWRLLGESSTKPQWPANPSELSAEVELHKRIASLIDKLQVPASKLAPAAMLHDQQAVRWGRVVERASSESTLAAAWDLRKAFEIDAPQLDALSPIARFNLWMWRTRGDINRSDDTSLAYSIDQLKKAAGELKNHPAAGQVLAALGRGSAKEPFADQNPGDTFKVALLGAQPAVEFKRIAADGQRPFYLSTSEVSLGQFAAVIEAAGAWDACRHLPWASEPGKPDQRRGPRVWEWIDGTPPKIGPAQLWLASESDNDFPIELRARRFNRMLLSEAAGGNPSDQHPMQQISAEGALWFAGLTGCRLPTAQEWAAAYQQFEKGASPDQWNLRDRTWELQRGYVSAAFAALQPAQWPDEGIFRPEGLPISAGHDARSRPNTDGVLFFRPAGVGGGTVFHHLVGNVGEYLCNAPEQFDAISDKRAPESIRKFAQEAMAQLAVIGGSALSPPELPLDKPLPITRTDQCYSDVGFRLAFTAPAKSLAERTRWALQGQPYLWPNTTRARAE